MLTLLSCISGRTRNSIPRLITLCRNGVMRACCRRCREADGRVPISGNSEGGAVAGVRCFCWVGVTQNRMKYAGAHIVDGSVLLLTVPIVRWVAGNLAVCRGVDVPEHRSEGICGKRAGFAFFVHGVASFPHGQYADFPYYGIIRIMSLHR